MKNAKCVGGGPRLACDRCRTLHQKCSLVQQGSDLANEKLDTLCTVLAEMVECQRQLLALKLKKHGLPAMGENTLATQEKGVEMGDKVEDKVEDKGEDKGEGPSGVEREPEGPVEAEDGTLGRV